jgi:hypothetical protein
MATAKEQLLSMMNPQQARLLDQQMRGQQVAQRSQGAGMLSGLVQAYTGMGDVAQRATGITPMGRNEQMARSNTEKTTTMLANKRGNAIKAVMTSKRPQEQKMNMVSAIKNDATGEFSDKIIEELTLGSSKGGTPATKVLSDGSVIQVNNSGMATEVRPPTLAGMMNQSVDGLNESYSRDSIDKAQLVLMEGRKDKLSPEELHAKVQKTLDPKLKEPVAERMGEIAGLANNYGMFTEQLPRLKEALDNANLGVFGDGLQFMQKVVQEVTGVKFESTSDSELIDRFFSKEVLNAGQFLKGSFSDKDIKFLKDAVGNRGFTRDGLKEAVVDLATAKEVAYKTKQEFNSLKTNRLRNSYDFEKAAIEFYDGAYNKYRAELGLGPKKGKPNNALLPDLGKPLSSDAANDIKDFNDFFGNKKTK